MKLSEPKPEQGSAAVAIDAQLVEALAQLVTRLGLSEIEIAQGDFKIRISRKLTVAGHPVNVAGPPSAPGPAAALPPAEVPGTVKSPMVGTAYLRPSPDAPPFIEVGSQVRAGDKVLLVEAMKTFNEILAPSAGTVTGILVEDGQPVEYGQPLLVIE
ncbi:MAG TPA: biotin/lipoyl-containing protein [Methylocella sp.]|nr:biotin/lipoyl-containing protein [Methylocella sp.]